MADVILVKPHQRSANTAQTLGMVRQAGIAPDVSGSKGLWMGYVAAPPGPSDPHHHGDAESGISVVKGHVRLYFGARLEKQVEARPGDFLYVPHNTVHLEENLTKEPAELIVARNSAAFMVVNVPDPRKRP